MSDKKHGGKRPGAGRPGRIHIYKRQTIGLTAEDVYMLQIIAPANLSEWIRKIIKREYDNHTASSVLPKNLPEIQ